MRYGFARRLCLTVSCSTQFAVAVAAQQPDTVTLPPVIVTANRIPTTVNAVSSAVTVISGESLRARGIVTVADALRLTPGAAVVASGSFGGQISVFLRGGESDYVKVLIDGVPQNQPGGFYDFANLGTEDVERIEIVRGPVSVLYGSDAVSGVVQVFTRTGVSRPGGRLALGGGSYGTEWSTGEVSGATGPFAWRGTASRRTTSGTLPVNNDDRRLLLGASVRFTPDARNAAALSFHYGDAVYHFPTDGTGQISDSNQFTTDRGPSLSAEATHNFSERVAARASFAWHREDSRFDDASDSPGDTTAFCCFHGRDLVQRLLIGARTDVRLPPGVTLTAGLERELQRQSGTTLDTSRGNSGLYGQVLAGLGTTVTLTAGGRFDDNRQFGSHLTGRAGVAWRAAPGTRLRASLGTGFKEPSFFENFATGFSRGNPALRPERSRSWEVGVERNLAGDRFLVQATWFDQRFRDFIQYSPAPIGPDSVNYRNVGDATARGIELSMHAALGRRLALDAAYTYLRSRDAGTGERLLRRPTHSGSVQLSGPIGGRGDFAVTARHTGDRVDQDFSAFPAVLVTLPSHTVVDASAELRLSTRRGAWLGLMLTGRVENLFGTRYDEVLHFPSPRRTLLLGGELTVGR
jgi:vitamin B12 transporter